jgi:nicotinamidase/pyrazinamidase
LNTDKIDKVFPKGTDVGIDSYSGFFDNGHRKSTGMGDFLQQKDVKEVYVMGLATDYCVKFTALDAAELGFETYLISDATKGVNIKPDDVENAFQEMKKQGIQFITSKEITS